MVASRLYDAATRHADPVLAIEAAEVALLLPAVQGVRLATRALALARSWLDAAPDFMARPELAVGDARLDLADLAPLRARCDLLDRLLRGRPPGIPGGPSTRHSGQELRAGATMAAVGIAGAGLLAGGFAVAADRSDKLAAVRGEAWRYDLTSLDAQGTRATRMITAGAVTTVIGLTLGLALLGAGAGELRRAQRASRRARLRLAINGGATFVLQF